MLEKISMSNYGYPYGNFTLMPQINSIFDTEDKSRITIGEGIKTYIKGVTNPIKNIIKKPSRALVVAGISTALIIATGGAINPFIIAMGLGVGGAQLSKGIYNLITGDTKKEKLEAIEDMGEGTFTLGTALLGAKYNAGKCSAVTKNLNDLPKDATIINKIGAIIKGLSTDCVSLIKSLPAKAGDTIRNLGTNISSFFKMMPAKISSFLSGQGSIEAELISITEGSDNAISENIIAGVFGEDKIKSIEDKINRLFKKISDIEDGINEGAQLINSYT